MRNCRGASLLRQIFGERVGNISYFERPFKLFDISLTLQLQRNLFARQEIEIVVRKLNLIVTEAHVHMTRKYR